MTTPNPGFPFTAVVGQERLQLALILNAINPRIGGVVVRGEKGTAKTTTVRAFAELIDGPLVNLPIGATEDRVVGSLDLEAVLTTGRANFQPGLLSQADGGVLYVDEVNLLPDHLVDVLLDAASTGAVTVERDGISHSAPASFVLVGTMNPEEGELRPQLLDRFGLAVEVAASRDVSVRAEIMRRRLAYESSPATFVAGYVEDAQSLAQKIAAARVSVDKVQLSDVMLQRIAHLCASFDVDGMRADLVIARAAVAHAAWRGAFAVEDADIRVAAELALPHRKRRNPFDDTGLDESELDEALDQARSEIPDSEPSEPSEPQETPADTPEPTSDGKAGQADSGLKFPS
ncbi:AAA family ATPase [Staphylococcus chromogenes]|nr:AAA family ATPase [Staphylococcus chromogenes]